MSMFDHINFEIECPTCEKMVTDFQSKDSRRTLYRLDYWEVDNFYSSCDYCGTWIEFNRKTPRPYMPIENYVMTVELSEQDEKKIIRNSEGKIIGFQGSSDN